MLAIASAQPTAAQSIRTFVSAMGSNASALCTATAPCLTFAGALAKTTAGGEITVLDPGDYGPVTINKSVSIVADGVEAGIQVSSGTAIVVNAGANDIVILRGLIIDGLGNPATGIVTGGGALHVQKCVVRDFGSFGIRQSEGAQELYVSDTLVAGNDRGIVMTGSRAVLDRVQVEGSESLGIAVAGGGASATVRDSMIASNGVGFAAFTDDGTFVRVTVEGSAAVNNGTGVSASLRGTVVIVGSTIAGNTTGLSSQNGGVIASLGNNRIAGNDTNGVPTTTVGPR